MIGCHSDLRCAPHVLRASTARVERWAPHRARLSFQSFERGIATTLGVALQRTLLSSLQHRAPSDATGSPVCRADWTVEPARSDLHTALARLVLDVETDGSAEPTAAVPAGARLLGNLLRGVIDAAGGLSGPPQEVWQDPPPPPVPEVVPCWTVESLGLSVRAARGLAAANIQWMHELVRYSERDLLRCPSLGRRSVGEIRDALAARGLILASDAPGKPPARGSASA